MVFDGSVADTWEVRMVGSVLTARTKLISPGQLYTFIIRQGEIAHRFIFPVTCRNAPPVNQEPNSVTVQNFVGLVGGFMQANVPAASL